jgi:hypothetical protein
MIFCWTQLKCLCYSPFQVICFKCQMFLLRFP